jgi:Na+/H+-dicarboxylate symporter
MMRTATNVAGQIVAPIIVAAREGILDRDAYASATASPVEDDPRAGSEPREQELSAAV